MTAETERKATALTDLQADIVSEAFRRIRKVLCVTKQLCDEQNCNAIPVMEAIADLVATRCGQQIK